MDETPVVLRERTDPTVIWSPIEYEDGAGVLRPYVLDGDSLVTLYVKATKDTVDPVGIVAEIVNTGAVSSTQPTRVRAALTAAQAGTATPGTTWYHLDVVKDGRRDVLAFGPWTVENV